MERHPRSIFVLVALAVAAGAGCCRYALREKVTPYPPSAPHRAPWRLNRELLMPETSRILIVVDVADGREPRTEPLDLLAEIASKYGGRPASWVRMGRPGAPALEWGGDDQVRCPAAQLDESTTYLLVRYGRSKIGAFGQTSHVYPPAECGKQRTLYIIHVDQESLARYSILWLTRTRLEENTLIHEYGHALGLGSNPSHGYWSRYPLLRGGSHCTHPECALTVPRWRGILYNAYRTGLTFRNLRDYCEACRRDIDWAKRYWRTGESFPESPRLQQPDPTAVILGLRERDFRMQGDGAGLVELGKLAMPGLMKRMETLPGGGDDSPRAFADWVAKTIVGIEARKRAGEGWVQTFEIGDRSAAMSKWWNEQGARFIAGDDWELPESVGLVRASKPAETDR